MTIALLTILIGLTGFVTAASFWLSAWVPTKGKAWLEAQLERTLPLDVTIGTMRYSLWSGLLLEEVTATDRHDPQTQWVAAHTLKARVGWLSLLIRRQVAVRLEGTLKVPCETDVVMSGRYGIRTRRLAMDLLTSDIQIEGVAPQLAQSLPPALKAGGVRVNVRVNWQPQAEPVITGRVMGTNVVWEQDPVRITSDVTAHGTVIPPAQDRERWSVDLTVRTEHGRLEGLPVVKEAAEVAGLMRLTSDRLTIERLHGTTWGSPWQIEGHVALLPESHADLRLRTHVELATLAAQLEAAQAWQPNGDMELAIQGRGPLSRWPEFELIANATVQDTSLGIPGVPHRIEQLTGTIQYDHLNRRFTIETLTGRLGDQPIVLTGTVTDLLTPSPRFTGQARLGTLDGRPTSLVNGSVTVSGTWLSDRVIIETGEVIFGASSFRARGEVSRLPAPSAARQAGLPHQASQLAVTGTVDLSDLARLPWVDLKALDAWQLDGESAFQLEALGPLDDWRSVEVRGTIRADEVTVRALPVRALSAELEQGQGRLLIRVMNAIAADGRLLGEFLIEQDETPARYLLEFDLMRAELGQLASAIPAWREPRPFADSRSAETLSDRSSVSESLSPDVLSETKGRGERHIQGTLSCHASLLGVWRDRASLRGEGWLQAAGERLAELPLLDRILRGFFGVLADRLGLSNLRTAQITELAGQVRLANERLVTDDLRLRGWSGPEPITILVRGSVGLDKTLDLTVEPELSEQLVLQAPKTSTIAGTILKTVGGLERLRRLVGRHHLGGTIDNPQYQFEFTLDQLLNQLLPSGLQQLLESLR